MKLQLITADKIKTSFYTKTLPNEEKSATMCRNRLVHDIEKLYVNKHRSGSSPETELGQSAPK